MLGVRFNYQTLLYGISTAKLCANRRVGRNKLWWCFFTQIAVVTCSDSQP